MALPLVWRHLPLVVHADEHRCPAVDWLCVLLLTLAMGTHLLATEFGEQLGFSSPLLAREGIMVPQVLHLFSSPQLLLRGEEQRALVQFGQAQGFDASALLDQARLGLVSGVPEAFFGCLVLTLVTWLLSRHLTPFVRREGG